MESHTAIISKFIYSIIEKKPKTSHLLPVNCTLVNDGGLQTLSNWILPHLFNQVIDLFT